MSSSQAAAPKASVIEMRPAQQAYLGKLWTALQEYRQKVEPQINQLSNVFNEALAYIMDDLGVPRDGTYRIHESGAAFVKNDPVQDQKPTLIKGAQAPGEPAEVQADPDTSPEVVEPPTAS